MIQELQNKIHNNAVKKGFWEEPINLGEKMMLIVTEIAEMCEAHRKGRRMDYSLKAVIGWVGDDDFKLSFEKHVKDTLEDEMADAMIRLLDMAKKLDIPIEDHILAKIRYNSLRPYKHGKQY